MPYLSGQPGLTNTDWQDAIFRSATIQNHTLSISGGKDNVKFYVSGNYMDQRGVVISSGFKRYSARANVDVKSGRLTAGVNLNPTYSYHDLMKAEGPYLGEGVVGLALQIAPIFPVYNADGSYNFGHNGWGYGATSILNPVAIANQVSDKLSQLRVLGNVYAQYDITKDLSYRLSLGTDINCFQRDYYRPSTLEIRDRKGPSTPTGFSRAQNFVNWLVENTLNYNHSFGLHTVSALAGFSSQKDRRVVQRTNGYQLPQRSGLYTQCRSGIVGQFRYSGVVAAVLHWPGAVRLQRQISAVGGYSGRRLVALRSNNRYGYFPSVSAGWNLSQEAFLKSVSWLSDLKTAGQLRPDG